jgi:hypothetical protein
MRIWSLNPKYLDSIGLIACWREALLGQAVLLGKTKGYKNHSQLLRFKNSEYPIRAIGSYLTALYEAAKNRGYNFDAKKINQFYRVDVNNITVNKKQLIYEFNHLQDKLYSRNKTKYTENFELIKHDINKIEAHPLFTVVDGEIEEWEKIK